MKKLFILSLSVLALAPALSGTTTPADAGVTTVAQATDITPELLQALKAQAASGSLSRPL